jgi:dTDP-4-dehydrorhamnose reductase
MPDAPILVTGSSGLLGMDLVEVLAEAGPVVPMTHQELDITDKRQVMARLREIRPRVVVNCAAFTRVDECEAREEEARRVNAHGPSVLAAATHHWVPHWSTFPPTTCLTDCAPSPNRMGRRSPPTR